MTDSAFSTPDWTPLSHVPEKKAWTFRRFAIWLCVGAVFVAGAVAGGYWIGDKVNSTNNTVSSHSDELNALKKQTRTLENEVSRLNGLLAAQKKGNAEVTQLLKLAGTAVSQLETQMTNICNGLNDAHISDATCNQVNFVIPPAGTTTTTTTVPTTAKVLPAPVAVTTTTMAFEAPIVTTTTTTVVVHGHGHGGKGHSK